MIVGLTAFQVLKKRYKRVQAINVEVRYICKNEKDDVKALAQIKDLFDLN